MYLMRIFLQFTASTLLCLNSAYAQLSLNNAANNYLKKRADAFMTQNTDSLSEWNIDWIGSNHLIRVATA